MWLDDELEFAYDDYFDGEVTDDGILSLVEACSDDLELNPDVYSKPIMIDMTYRALGRYGTPVPVESRMSIKPQAPGAHENPVGIEPPPPTPS